MRYLVRLSKTGRITIPKEIRKAIDLRPDDLLSISLTPSAIELRPVRVTEKQGSPWLKELYELFAPVRASLEGVGEEEINAAIDEALRHVGANPRRSSSC